RVQHVAAADAREVQRTATADPADLYAVELAVGAAVAIDPAHELLGTAQVAVLVDDRLVYCVFAATQRRDALHLGIAGGRRLPRPAGAIVPLGTVHGHRPSTPARPRARAERRAPLRRRT